MRYTKHDAQMTQGVAILCMVLLHLFCRKGGEVFGTPLLWINESTPVVYLFGFFSEICVSLYSICAGYGQELLWQEGRSGLQSRICRIFRLLVNYWIVLVLFAALGMFFDKEGRIPGNFLLFVKSIVLLHSYNGAWWYLNTYVLLLLLPPRLLLMPVHKMKVIPGLLFCGGVHVLWYIVGKLGILSATASLGTALSFAHKEVTNLIGILPCVWVGGFFCRYHVLDKVGSWYEKQIPGNKHNKVLFTLSVLLFFAVNAVRKAVIMAGAAVAVFILFNLWEKDAYSRKAMLFLGKHSTNIWLVHMFFYAYFLRDLVLRLQYPVLMLAALLAWSVASSCVIMQISDWMQNGLKWMKHV